MRDLWLEANRIREEGGDHGLEAWLAALTPDERAALGRQFAEAQDAMQVIARILRAREDVDAGGGDE